MKSFAALAVAALVVISYANNIFIVHAGDSDPLQDFCVADNTSKDGIDYCSSCKRFACKNAMMVSADDFFVRGLDKPGNTSNMLGSMVTPVNVVQLAGLNTLGISMARIDFSPYGLNPPHTHPRATEILVVMEGSLYVGFITTGDKLIYKTLEKGDVFVFPKGLVHFQQNVGYGNAVALAALSSQNPGTQQIAKSLFGASGPVDPSVLAKAFMIDPNLVKLLQAKFSAAN